MKLAPIATLLIACGTVEGTPPETETDAQIPDTAEPTPDSAATCATSPAMLKARWRGEMTANDDLAQMNGTATSVSFTQGRHGFAFQFDASSDHVVADPDDTLWPAGSFGVEAWVKTVTSVSAPGFTAIVQKYDCGGSTACGSPYWALLIDADDHPEFQFRTVGGPSQVAIASTVDIVDGQFHHLVGVRDVVAQKQLLYVDGELAVSRDIAGTDLNAMTNEDQVTDPVTIGGGQDSGADTFSSSIIGAVDEVSLYFAAPSAAEVAAAFAAPDGYCP